MSNITVGSTAALSSALQSAQSGDTILLQAGTYTGLDYVFYNRSFAQGVTIASADPSHPATLTHFGVAGSNGLTFENVELVTQSKGYFDFQVYKSSNIHFDHVSVHGSMDGNPQDDIEGISFQGSTNVSVTNSEFQQLERAMTFGSSNNVTVANNNVHNIEITGVSFGQVGNVTVSGNSFSNFDPVVGVDHPDAIQFLTSGTTASSHDISITNNVIFRGTGGATQGIFLRDQVGTLPYLNVNIADNLIDGTGYGGIAVGSAHGVTVTGNVLISLNGVSDMTPLQVFDSANVTLTNNQAANYGTDGDTGLAQSGDILNTAVADGGVAALNTWLATHTVGPLPGTSPSIAAPILPSAPLAVPGQAITGTGGPDALTGGAGNDTLDGQGGLDTLSGGAGDDTYIVPNSSALVAELPGGGNDTVIAKGSYTLPANVENLVINSTVANSWAGYGNALDNQLTGNAGDNYLDGGAGNDTLAGGAGIDTLIGGLGDDRLVGGADGDTFRFAPGGGHDTVVDYGLGADRIDISAYQKAGLSAAMHDVGSDLVISFTNGDSITLSGHHAADMKVWTYGWAI